MKTRQLFAAIALVVTSIVFNSCEYEPVDSDIEIVEFKPDQSKFIGNYRMTAYNTSIPTDLDLDGNSSVNQMDETTCYDFNSLVLNEDNTFVYDVKGVEIVSDGMTDSFNCFSKSQISGTWILSGNKIIVEYTVNNSQKSEQFIISGNTLQKSFNNIDIVASSNSKKPIYINGGVTVVYTKQ